MASKRSKAGGSARKAAAGTKGAEGWGLASSGDSLDRAQDRIYDAWEAPTAARRLALAREALAISKDCVDAYLILAEAPALSIPDSILLVREAVAIGKRVLGAQAFEDDVGHFWGLLETRPYMRALAQLAELTLLDGEIDEALASYRELLRLNPNDNQGIRYLLAAVLLDHRYHDELSVLLRRYDEATAAWTYTAALLAFREHGDIPRSRDLLAAALGSNPHVPAYLLDEIPLPAELPDYVGFGDETEAMAVAERASLAWRSTNGARSWLRRSATASKPRGRTGRRSPR